MLNLKSNTIKYFVMIVISFVLSFYIVNILISADRTEVMINYIASEESGTLQLFYRGSEQNFSEDQSIVNKVSENGSCVFRIPKTNIDELRIDTDGITIFRIRSIEISKLGYTQIIDSGNWSDYYRTQYDMDSLFDDGNLISYQTTGIDPYIVFGIDGSSKISEGYIQYYLLLCAGTVLCFLGIVFISKIIDKKGGLKRENIYVLIRCICAVFVLIQVVNVDIEIIKSVNTRKQTEYIVYISEAEPVQVPENLNCKFIVHGKELLTQQFMIDATEDISGSISYKIVDQDGNIVTDVVQELESVVKKYDRNWDVISINCEQLNLNFGQEYQICMKIKSDVPVNIIMNSSGEIQQKQTMKFVYGKLYNSIVIIVSIILLIAIIWICRYGFSPRLFLASAFVLGTISCFVLTPCTADDEYRHFLRVYDLVSSDTKAYMSNEFSEAKGNVIAEIGGAPLLEVPYELNRLRMVDVAFNYDNVSYNAEMNYQGCLDEVMRLLFKSDSNETSIVSIIATKSISVWAYLPQVILAFVGKFLGMNAVGIFYMARIGNMLFSVFIAYACIRLLPNYKNIFLLLHFAPNAYWLSVSCNRDIVATSLAMFGVTYIIYVKENKKAINLKRIIFITILFSILAIIKLPYIMLISTLLLLGADNFPNIMGNWRRKAAQVGIALGIFIISIGTYKIETDMDTIKKMFTGSEVLESVPQETEEPAIESKATHLSYALEHPAEILNVLWQRYRTIFKEDLYRSIAGYRYHIGKYYFWLALLLLAFSRKMLTFGQRIYMLGVYLITWFLIIVVGYTFMPPDYGSVWGISPRYMIPILPVFAMVICSGNERTGKIFNEVAPVLLLGMASNNIVSMINVFY